MNMRRAASQGNRDQAAFLRLGPDGRPAGDPAGRVVLVPGEDVPLLPLDLPRGLRGQSRDRVAWRQLHDLTGLAQDEVEMRPYPGPGKPDGWDRVLVVDSARMARWRGDGDPKCRAVLPDYLGLPAAPGLWVVEIGADTIRTRLGVADGFTCGPAAAPLMLRRALADDPPRAVLCLNGTAPWLDALMAAADIPVVTEVAALSELDIDPPQILAHGELLADLRTDPRAARDRLRRRILPWRWTVLAALVAVSVWATGQIRDIRAMEAETAATRDEVMTIVRDRFVPAGPILDIRAQVSRALAARQAEVAAASGRVSPLVLFGQVADVIMAHGAATDLVSFTRNDGLEAELRLPDFAAVDRLTAALETAGIGVDLRDARASGDTDEVRVDLRLHAKRGEDG